MNKQEILAVVYKMLEQYKEVSIEFLNSIDMRRINFNRGFCVWIHNRGFMTSDFNIIINELLKDCIKPTTTNVYWYPVFTQNGVLQDSITPRIAHLERTIARLEQEIIRDTQIII